MGLRDIFSVSSNEIYSRNMELLEEHDLVNAVGNPRRVFVKFLESRDISIYRDEIDEDIIGDFASFEDSVDIEMTRIRREKNSIFNQRKVWINIAEGDELEGTDLHLHHDGIVIERTGEKILYSDMTDIELGEGGWSKNRMSVHTENGTCVFEINEEKSVALKEILEDNMENSRNDELDQLLRLQDMLEEGRITREEYEARKSIIYSDDIYCTQCGEKLEEDSDFCSNCGHPVDG